MQTRHAWIMALSVALAAGTGACAKAHQDHPAGETAEPGKEPFGELTIDQLDARMADAKAGRSSLAIFDNNPHDRFDKSHIPGAKWVAFNDVKASDLPADKDTTLVFYCANEH